MNGYFNCNDNNLKSLEGIPKIVKSAFNCSHNQLTSLKRCPEIVNGSFDCSYNKLKIEEIKNLIEVEIRTNYINIKNNENLGEIQNITDFNNVKNILQIYQEKKDLNSLIITHDDEIIKKNIIKI